jgi:transglutaminase-like putative cysteine protease
MQRTVKWLNGFFIVLTFLLLTANKSFAEGEFETTYDVSYKVQENGETQVRQEITLTNKTKDLYASEYTLIIGSPRLKDIKASDSQGALQIDTQSSDTSTEIHVEFNRQVVGIGKTYDFLLEYTTLDTALKNGLVWEVNIPRLSAQTQIARYQVTLEVPLSFGPLMYISPEPVSSEERGERRVYTFNKEQIELGGASAAFGQNQLFAFTLKYHLQNPNAVAGLTTIALPPSILGRQEVIFESLDPEPKRIYTDSDGNYLAEYRVEGNARLEPVLKGFVRVFNQTIDPQDGGSFAQIPPKLMELYTRPQPFWEVDNPQIQTQAKTLLDRQKTVAQNARAIYDYVSQRLQYDKNARKSYAERIGAVKALNEPENNICMGYTDLFIALARAAGIPTRELDGYAYTADNVLRPLSIEFRGGDVLHSWVEFYDPHLGWVAIDPTWGSTTNGLDYFNKLDTNHFVFVVKGLSSEEPYPAGAYKIDPDENGDVTVGFARAEDVPADFAENLEMEFKLRQDNLAGLPFSGIVKIKNTGQKTAFDVKADFKSLAFNIPLGKENNLEDILPGQEKEFKFTLQAPKFNSRFDEDLKLELVYQNFDGKVLTKEFGHQVSVYPFFRLPLSVYHLIALVLLLPSAAGTYFLWGFFKKKRGV